MSIMMYMLRHMKSSTVCNPKPTELNDIFWRTSSSEGNKISPRMAEFKKKLKEIPFSGNKPDGREVTPIKKLDQKTLKQPETFQYEPWPDNRNPHTGEIGGPRGPEPTRYGDWERKGRCSDF